MSTFLNQQVEKFRLVFKQNDSKELVEDYKRVDKFMLSLIALHWFIVTFISAYAYNTYTFGFISGGVLFAFNYYAYKHFRGELIFRLIAAISLMTFTIIMIQQNLGRIEMHFHVFIVLSFLVAYKDMRPLSIAALFIAVHHILFNYLQEANVEIFNTPIVIFNYGCGWDIVMLHAIFVVFEWLVLLNVIYHNRQQFINMNKLQKEVYLQNEELSVSEEKIRLVLDAVDNSIVGLDNNGNITFVNTAISKTLHYSSEEILDKNIKFIFKNGDDKFIKAYRYGEFIHLKDEILIGKDNLHVEVECNIAPINKEGSVIGAVAVFRDISEQKKLQETLELAKESADRSNKAKSDFLSNMSHEIRTPMNAIIGMSHLALATDLSNKQRDYLEKIHGSTKSLLGIINDILDFSKIEAGKLDIEIETFRLDAVLENLSTLIAYKAQEKGLEFLFDIASDVPMALRGDSLRLGQVLTNLSSNALKFTHEGVIKIRIEMLTQDKTNIRLKFSIEDTGIGMTEEQVSKLFQSFTQADTSTSRKYGGTGLGLSIAKQLVELMDGDINVESRVKVGTTFSFDALFELADAVEGTIVENTFTDLNDLKILVVDDIEDTREILEHILLSFNFRVTTASSGQEAIDILESEDAKDPYKLVLMDWKMPEMDGIEASKNILVNSKIPELPLIVMATAYSREEVSTEIEKNNLDGMLLKPFTPSDILDMVMNVFGKGVRKTNKSEDKWRINTIESIAGAEVLLVEDNIINQQVASELLENVGLEVDIANNGLEAVDAVKHKAYDVVLMDLQMPEMDGFEATEIIRSEEQFKNLPILAMTANAMIEDKEKCLLIGMNGHISKPIDPDELFKTLLKWIPQKERSDPIIDSDKKEVSNNDEFPEDLAGIDIERGLKHIQGNKKLYMKLLKDFYISHKNDMNVLREAIASEDYALAERLVHTVKGIASTLGAKSLEESAAVLEKQVRENSIDDLNTLAFTNDFEKIMSTLQPLLKQISDDKSNEKSSEKTIDYENIKVILDNIKEALEELSTDSEDLAEALKVELSGSEFENLARKLLLQTADFEFEEAEETCKELELKMTQEV